MVKDRAQAPKNFLRENEISLLSKSLFMLNCPIGKNCAKGTAKSSSNLKLGTIQLVINAANYSFKRCQILGEMPLYKVWDITTWKIKTGSEKEICTVILLHEKFLQYDWLRAVVFQLNLKYDM